MPRHESSPEYAGLGILFVVIGMFFVGCAGISGFGDRMPDPPPQIKRQFESIDRRIGYLMAGGGACLVIGISLIAASATGKSDRDRNRKRD